MSNEKLSSAVKRYPDYEPQILVLDNVEEAEKIYQYVMQNKNDFSESQLKEIDWEKGIAIHNQIVKIEKAKQILKLINDLLQPSSMTINDKSALDIAKKEFNDSDSGIKQLVPAGAYAKLADCEESINNLTDVVVPNDVQLFTMASSNEQNEQQSGNSMKSNDEHNVISGLDAQPTNNKLTDETEKANSDMNKGATVEISKMETKKGNTITLNKKTGEIDCGNMVKVNVSAENIDVMQLENRGMWN